MENMNNEAREIPYWKNILVNCPNCWFKWEPAKYRKWNIFLEIILWLLFLIPWAIYTALRHINTYCLCPKCKQQFLLETDCDNNLIDMLCKIRRKQLCWFWIIVIGFSILWVASISWIYKNYQKSINENNRTYNYQQNDTYVEPQKVDEQSNEVTLPEIKEEEVKAVVVENIDKEENKLSVKEQVTNIINEAVDWINDALKRNNNFGWASCSWDCAKRIIDINFNIDTYLWDSWVNWIDSTMRTYATIIYDKLKEVKDISVTINLIYWWQLKHSYIASKQWVIIK